MMSTDRGFTLIEMMIVIAVIGILAAIAIPAYRDYTLRAQVSEGAILTGAVKIAMVDYYNHKGRWPATNASAGLARSTSIIGKYVSTVDINTTTGKIRVVFGSSALNKAISGSILVFSGAASTKKGSITWNCKSNQAGGTRTNIPNKYLPTVCRT